MDSKKVVLGIICSILIGSFFMTLNASADSENNDSLNSAETLSEGTVTGSVMMEGIFEDGDEDYYKITVPEGKDVNVLGEKTDEGEWSITIQGYNSDRSEMSIFEIWMFLETPGETDTESWYNGEGQDTTIYLGVTGEGDYSITISFSSDTEEAVGALAGACFLGTVGLICIPLFFVILVIVIIIIIIVKVSGKKKKQQTAQPNYPQQGQMPQQQYPPQGQMQQQYPPQGQTPQQYPPQR